MNEKKNRDCTTSFLEIYVQPYDFEKMWTDEINQA